MTFNWSLTSVGQDGLNIAWTEVLSCDACGLNSRMRAVWDFVTTKLSLDNRASVYLPEAVTPGFAKWKARFPNAVGSEYISSDALPGSLDTVGGLNDIRHEDLTKLSFADDTFELIVSQDVFEHIPDFSQAFRECFRTLKANGTLVISVPFFPENVENEVIVTRKEDGTLHSDRPFEYHGNPVSSDGSLCFQHFGWGMLEDLRRAGFSKVRAHSYWAPTHGHLGGPFFIFSATK